LAGALVALSYCLLAGFGVPAQRTLYMLGIVALALWLGRISSASHVLCAALLAVVLIDPVSVGYMAGSQIDFVDDLIGASFKVKNPKATASCGCGTSFSL